MAARSGGVHADMIAERRRRVAAFRLRGLTQREIVKALADMGYVNPQTDKPYSLSVINNDLKAIREDWKAEATAALDEHIAAMLAEIREVRRRAWANQDLDTVLKGLKQERDLLGLDAPKELVLRHHVVDTARRFALDMGLDPDEVVAEAERILAGAA